MSMFVAALIFVVLLAVAIAHLMWAVGSPWPIRDPALLARTVIGRPGITRVPRLGALAVAILVLAAGVLALSLADHDAGGWWLTLIGVALHLSGIRTEILRRRVRTLNLLEAERLDAQAA